MLISSDLCRFCLESDKTAVSLRSPQILVRADKKIVDLKEILKFLNINFLFNENLPSKLCQECQTTIINFYTLKKAFLENESMLTSDSQSLEKHERLHKLIPLIEEFCTDLSDEETIKIHKSSSQIIIEKCNMEKQQEVTQIIKAESPENNTVSTDTKEPSNVKYVQYENEEYIDEEDYEDGTNADEFSDQVILYEEGVKYDAQNNSIEYASKSQEAEYEIHLSETEQERDEQVSLELPQEDAETKPKLKRKQKTTSENEDSGLIAKKYKLSFVDLNVMVQEDDSSNNFMCSNCSTMFPNEKAANEHVMKYGKYQLCTSSRCDECMIVFQSERASQRHKSYHFLEKISSDLIYFDCEACKCSFGVESDYEKHVQCHEDPNYKLTFEGKPQLEGCEVISHNLEDAQDCWACGHCGMNFNTTNDLNFHLTIFHANLYCPFDKQFYGKSLSYLIDHLKTKHPDKIGETNISFFCSHCFVEYSSKTEMKEHEKVCDKKRFQCTHCPKKFALERQLKEHLEFVNGTTKFTCNFCDKKFSNKSSLTVHTRIHSREKPYTCNFPGCNKSFRTNSHLNAHMDSHNETKNFKCEHCDLMLQTRAARRAHEKSHSFTYICPLCKKDFKQRSHVIRHTNTVHKIKYESADFEIELGKLVEN